MATRVGYALNVHYCEDKIAKISLAYNSTNCNMESNFQSKSISGNELTKKLCCEHNIQLFQNHELQRIKQDNFLKITIVENVFFRGSNFKTLKSYLLSKAYLFNSLSPHQNLQTVSKEQIIYVL
tara:strand:- start:268 stop:639 length:372 start_codon:yes stop_codon:yes gene_type:complete